MDEQQSLFTDKDSHENRVVVDMDPVFTALFTIECVLKVIGMGFFMDAGSYLRDPWNWLGFTVVVGGLLPYVFGAGVNVSTFRVFRALRPLKSLLGCFVWCCIFLWSRCTTFLQSLTLLNIYFKVAPFVSNWWFYKWGENMMVETSTKALQLSADWFTWASYIYFRKRWFFLGFDYLLVSLWY